MNCVRATAGAFASFRGIEAEAGNRDPRSSNPDSLISVSPSDGMFADAGRQDRRIAAEDQAKRNVLQESRAAVR